MKVSISLWLSFRVASENAGLYECFDSLDLVFSARLGKPNRRARRTTWSLLYRAHHKHCCTKRSCPPGQVYGGPNIGPRADLPIRTKESSTKESSTKKSLGSIGNFTLTSMPGYRPATMLAACWTLWARTDTQNRALPLRTSTETCTIWLTSFLLSNLLI